MLDRLNREINYMRISLTDRCNLRCRYCMPPEGVSLKEHQDILSFEEIERVVRIATTLGIRKIRLTGGEPLVRKNLPSLVRAISAMPLIDDLAVTTNGILFADLAADLKKAGLNRVNMSLDTMRPERFDFITRGGSLASVMKGLEKALSEEYHPVKLNTVLIRGFNDDEIFDFARLAYEQPIHIRFIEFMPVGHLDFWDDTRIIKNEEVIQLIAQKYSMKPGRLSRGNGPAKYYFLDGGQGSVGFISPMSNHFCGECNRIRMTADGQLRACLYDGNERDLKALLKNGSSDQEIREVLQSAILSKPERHLMVNRGWGEEDRKMCQIGG